MQKFNLSLTTTCDWSFITNLFFVFLLLKLLHLCKGSESESAMTKPVPNSVQSPRGKWANKVGDATNEVEDILRRYEDNEEPKNCKPEDK